jgi:hypothetical protein
LAIIQPDMDRNPGGGAADKIIGHVAADARGCSHAQRIQTSAPGAKQPTNHAG